MSYINISHKKLYDGIITSYSTEIDAEHSVNNILKEEGFWCTKKSNSILHDFFIIDYKEEVPINFIEISTSSSGKTTFPIDFRIESSIDGSTWRNIQTEKLFNLGDSNLYPLYIPLTLLRYIKMLITKPGKVGTKFFSEIGRFSSGIAGIKKITSSSSSSYKYDAYKLLDLHNDTYWESNINQKKGKENINIDLGDTFHINRLALLSIDSPEHGFPENFTVSFSKDNELWTPLLDERNFIVEASKKYFWNINPTACRFININMDRVKVSKNSYATRLCGIEIYGAIINFNHTHNIGELVPNASIFQYGLVKLAKNGEEIIDGVIQSSDSRLKNASTLNKGIVQLAEDGEEKPFLAVQASDPRLKKATESRYGIVKLAKDQEDNPDVVVKGNDSRLQKATETNSGIVKICRDGEYSEFGVVSGNDSRIHKATITSFGITRLADNGETNPNCVVQGNDKRLRNATINHKGIVELAENGEDREDVAVQGSDKRLKDATTISKGIVELAENGEEKEGVAVQGNDDRLKIATENSYGIVRLAKNKEKKNNSVVQANDDRLSDPRQPLPHEHKYASINHEFNSHTGTIKIIDKKEENISGIVPPSDGSAIIYAKNESEHPGAVGIAGISNPECETSIHSYGVLGHGRFAGVRGQSGGNTEGDIKGAGVLGISRFGAGGVFASEHNYSLVADGYGRISEYDDSVKLNGNGDALYVNGNSLFSGKLFVNNKSKENDSPVNIVEMFEVDEEQFIMAGDILVASEKGGSVLTRSMSNYSRTAIGIVSGNPSVIIDNSGMEKKIYPIVLAGKALCRIDARGRKVKPGDFIVTSDTPGCGMAGEIDSLNKIGSVLGKALDRIDGGIGIIPVFVVHI